VVFLKMNGMALCTEEETLVKLVFSVAEGKTDKAEVIKFIRKYTINNPSPNSIRNPGE
jgi:prophage maintenance system killer protein